MIEGVVCLSKSVFSVCVEISLKPCQHAMRKEDTVRPGWRSEVLEVDEETLHKRVNDNNGRVGRGR